MISIIKEFVSKEASMTDWLIAIGTLSLALISVWPNIKTTFSKYLFPKIDVKINNKGNVVISSDGKIHKIQVPFSFENLRLSKGYIEGIQLQISDPQEKTQNLDWHKFIENISGLATVPLSDPRRFLLGPKEIEEKFIQFWTEEDINILKGEYLLNFDIVMSYLSSNRRVKKFFKFKLDEMTVKIIEQEKQICLSGNKVSIIPVNIKLINELTKSRF